MDNQYSLEEQLNLLVVRFANKIGYEYCIKSKETADGKCIDIEIGTWDKMNSCHLNTSFHHDIYLKNQNINKENTLQVADSAGDRRLYLDFLKEANSWGIQLSNDFEKIWKMDKLRYFVG